MKHTSLTLTLLTLLLGAAITSQHALSNPPLNSTTVHKHLQTLSPYSKEGEKFYTELSHSKLFETALASQRTLLDNPKATATSLTNLGTLLSLAAWDEKDAAGQRELFTQADKAFDAALKKSPHHWDAWMGKADLYGHSEDVSTERYAISILKQLLTDVPKGPQASEKKAAAQTLLSTLNQKYP